MFPSNSSSRHRQFLPSHQSPRLPLLINIALAAGEFPAESNTVWALHGHRLSAAQHLCIGAWWCHAACPAIARVPCSEVPALLQDMQPQQGAQPAHPGSPCSTAPQKPPHRHSWQLSTTSPQNHSGWDVLHSIQKKKKKKENKHQNKN